MQRRFKVVVNSSVIIALAKIGRLELLRELFGEVIIPIQVYEEVTREPTLPSAIEALKADWISIQRIENEVLFEELCSGIDIGEAAVIVLAKEIDADIVVLDDKLARRKADLLGLEYTGTIGLLILAKKKGLIESLKEELVKLRNKDSGYQMNYFRKFSRRYNHSLFWQ